MDEAKTIVVSLLALGKLRVLLPEIVDSVSRLLVSADESALSCRDNAKLLVEVAS